MKKPHIMAAQAIKKQLKIQFPDIKFAVRTGGCGYFSRIDVFYPVSVGFDAVKAVTKPFQMSNRNKAYPMGYAHMILLHAVID